MTKQETGLLRAGIASQKAQLVALRNRLNFQERVMLKAASLLNDAVAKKAYACECGYMSHSFRGLKIHESKCRSEAS